MTVDALCSEIEEDFGVVVTVATGKLDTVLVTHTDFSLTIEVTETQVRIHDIRVHRPREGIGGALASIICNWALDEEVDIVALNVLPDAEDWWVLQGFSRKNENNDLYCLSHKDFDLVEDHTSEDYIDVL